MNNNTPAPINGQQYQLTNGAEPDDIGKYLAKDDVRRQIAMALPKHISVDNMARACITVIRQNPDLLKCTKASLMSVIMTCSQLGIFPGPLGHAYFVGFRRKIKGENGQPDKWVQDVQLIIGYRGLIDLARRSGDIVTICGEAIHENDVFVYRKGYQEELSHEPNFRNPGKLIGFYAYATTKDGGRYATVMSLEAVEAIRQRSKAKDSGPWCTDYEEMGKKTVTRRLCKWLPLSTEAQTQIRQDELEEFGADVTAIEVNAPHALDVVTPALEAPPRPEVLSAAVKQAAGKKRAEKPSAPAKDERPADWYISYEIQAGDHAGRPVGEFSPAQAKWLIAEDTELNAEDHEALQQYIRANPDE